MSNKVESDEPVMPALSNIFNEYFVGDYKLLFPELTCLI